MTITLNTLVLFLNMTLKYVVAQVIHVQKDLLQTLHCTSVRN